MATTTTMMTTTGVTVGVITEDLVEAIIEVMADRGLTAEDHTVVVSSGDFSTTTMTTGINDSCSS